MIEGYTPVGLSPFTGSYPEGQIYQFLNVGFLQDRFEHYDRMNPEELKKLYEDRSGELTDEIMSGPYKNHPRVRYPDKEDIPAVKQDLIVKIMVLDRRLGRIESCEFDYGKGKRNFEGGVE